VRVLVTFPDGNAASAAAKQPELDALRQKMAQGPHVVTVSPPVFGDDYRRALLSAVLSVDPEDMGARHTIDWMRDQLPKTDANARIDVGGPTALIKDFDDRVSSTQPMVFAFVALIAFVMLLISIRSVFLAFKGVLMTVLSVAAAYGSLVVVFQWGWLQDLGFKPISSLDSTIPPLVLAMTFGLSMDYEIFLLTRIRERFLQTKSTRDAVAYGVSTSARTITSAALIMIAVFIGFAFAGMPLVAQLGVACAVAIAVDATVVRLVLVPALMAMFDEWNWWLPRWLARILPSVDFEKPIPKVDMPDVVIIPDDISSLGPTGSDLRMVVKSAARLKSLAPDTITVADPLALGVAPVTQPMPALVNAGTNGRAHRNGATNGARNGKAGPPSLPEVHPVTIWRGRLSVALDALETEADSERAPVARSSPVETTNVQLPTGDRLQVPTGAETLRLKSYLVMCRNTTRDFAEFAELVDSMETHTAAVVLAAMDRYYCGDRSRKQWVATQLVRRLADPRPSDEHDTRMSGPEAEADWAKVRERCLSVAIAMLEEAR
jgi:RND superfamily putative drug exporter